jgi:hypothetical protein
MRITDAAVLAIAAGTCSAGVAAAPSNRAIKAKHTPGMSLQHKTRYPGSKTTPEDVEHVQARWVTAKVSGIGASPSVRSLDREEVEGRSLCDRKLGSPPPFYTPSSCFPSKKKKTGLSPLHVRGLLQAALDELD